MKAVLALLCTLSTLPALAGSKLPASESYVLCGNPACVLVDRDGQPVMSRVFEAVEPLVGDLAIFTKAGQYGVVDRSGHTVLEPRHKFAAITAEGHIWAGDTDSKGTLFDARGQVLQTGTELPRRPELPERLEVELLATPQGTVLADAQGHMLSEAFDRIYQPDPDAQSMPAMRTRDGVRQTGQLLRSGRFIPTPPGTDGMDSFREGVAPVRQHDTAARSTRMGLLSVEGDWVLPLESGVLVNPAHDGLVTFSRAGLWGVADTRGRVRLSPRFTQIDRTAHHGRFKVMLPSGLAGVIDADGRWVVPAEFHAIEWIDDDFIAAIQRTLDTQGRTDTRAWLFDRDGTRLPGPDTRFAPRRVSGMPWLHFTGLDSINGLMDLSGRVVASDIAGTGRDQLPDTPEGPFFVRRGQQWAVVAAYGTELLQQRFSTVHQPYRNGRALADSSLLDEHGRVIATYATAAPHAAWPDTLDARIETRLDPCFSPNPTEPAVQPAALATLCADVPLRAMLRETQRRHHASLASAHDLLKPIKAQSDFHQRLLACTGSACFAKTLRTRLASIGDATQDPRPAAMPGPWASPQRKVPVALQRRLHRQLDAEANGNGGPWSWRFIDVNRDGHWEILATDTSGMHNNPFALFARGAEQGPWRLILEGSSNGEPRPLRPREPGQWPDLRWTEHGGAASGEVTIHRYRPGRYEPLLSCEMMWAEVEGAEPTPLLFCGDDPPWHVAAAGQR